MKTPEKESISFEGFISSNGWKKIAEVITHYFHQNEHFLKFIGYSVAISALFLSMGTEDSDLKRIQAFFLVLTSALIVSFIVKSLLILHRGNHGNIYRSVALIPTYIAGLLIFSFLSYLLKNFETEILFYLRWAGIPLLGLTVHFAFVFYFKLLSKIKPIEGGQIKTFFLFTLDLQLFVVYVSSSFNPLLFLEKITAPTFNNLFIVALFCISTLSELWPFFTQKNKITMAIDLLIIIVPLACIIVLGYLYISNSIVDLRNLMKAFPALHF